MTAKDAISNFISKELVNDDEMKNVGENESLLESGIIDSLAIMKLLTFIEEEFKLKVMDDELMPENFDTIASIVSLIDKKKNWEVILLVVCRMPWRVSWRKWTHYF